MPIVEAIGLTKEYPGKKAVDRVSFQVSKGECFGILGPNGAGKTSTFKMIYGSSTPTQGDLFVDQMNVKSHISKIKFSLGVVPQENGLDPDFSVFDNLLIFGSYYRLKGQDLHRRAHKVLHQMRLEEYADKSVEQLSGGMKRRLAIGRALLADPEILLLDEPTTGLDPQARQWIWGLLSDLKSEGKTLVLTTHYMEEAEVLCDRLMIMNQGKVLSEGTPAELIEKYVGSEVVEFNTSGDEMDYYVGLFEKDFSTHIFKNRVQIYVRQPQTAKDVIDKVTSTSLRVRPASLNDVFLEVSGRELVD